MTVTAVVNVRDLPGFGEPGFLLPEGHAYIGRENPAHNLPESEWANPYRVKKESDREGVIERYRHELESALFDQPETPAAEKHQRELRGRLLALRGMTLVCWCAPRACHGHVLAELIERVAREEERGGRGGEGVSDGD